ncbi:MAG: DNA-binding transcriptional regulator, LysR family [Pseudonocardiales bacterium]|nr:DNA-binding transcriptional regulator, LysR family [Pseudonocardiales bacterium]
MELRHLEHFLAVAEEHSFTRAAARIHLVQSALSVSIRSLERELGVRLFDRTTHRVELTDAGEALVAEARRTLEAADGARDAVAGVHSGLRGTVRIGIMHSLALIDLAALLTRYHRERPQVRLVPSAAAGGSVDLARDVADGRLDLAFAALPTGYPPALSVRPLATEEMMLACPPDHPFAKRRRIGLAELEGERFVDFPAGWGTRLSADRLFLDAGLRREIAVEVADVPTVSELVRAGFGFAFLAPSTVRDARRLVLRRVRPSPEFTVSLVTADERTPSAATRALIDLVTAAYPASGGSRRTTR